MRPLLYPTYLGRSWTLRNESSRPDNEVQALLGFVLDRTGGLSAKGAIHVLDAGRRSRGNYSGCAGSRKLGHSIPRWVGGRARFYMRLTLPRDDWAAWGIPEVCGHSTVQHRLMGEMGATELHTLYEEMLAAGETHLGRWPIFRLWDWREVLVNLGAHEAAHLIQYDRERGHSEVWCEEFAVAALTAYRESDLALQLATARAVTSTSTISEVTAPDLAGLPHGDVLVIGPATAASTTNRKEPTVAASTPTASDEAKTAEPMKDLFDSLLTEAVQVADSTAKVEKSAYVRVDLLLDEGKKHKTLAYVNLPSSKAVRVEVPKKGGGGYDVIRVEKPKDIDKALKAIKANHDRIVAAQAAA